MSSKTTSVALGDHFREFAERKVSEGRYGSTSEVIRAGLRMLESEEQKLEALRAAIQEGLDSGPGQEFDFDAWLDRRFPVSE
ncbi:MULTISPECIES: type II toxin-antitoxin system ParD family antitoxin [Sphingobium]|jgi:antitoxin ParD1/3/4|uniref:Antitoxin ParD1/3/4 n=1 Tax=Sphingobium xenophagum TaxID=121428 RepID=A0ABU1X522_SPHXE|nr:MULTISPECIES: type II toxin-antitoxin system ParD family antitoxin [Sphingobium]MDR7156656.1 antitoxin ParD1/3/4 [Sphingobium xenophagum]PBN43033.1 antitoxin ParD1 [Sphingobium sp. D43FB]